MTPFISILSFLCCIHVLSASVRYDNQNEKIATQTRIYFRTDKHDLDEMNKEKMDNLFEHLKDSMSYNIRIIGYTDYRGSSAYNFKLSQLRAQEAYEYLKMQYSDVINRMIIRAEGELPKLAGTPLREQRAVSIEVFENKTKTLVDLRRGHVGPMDEISMDKLYFQPGRHILLESSIPILHELEKSLKINRKVTIEIAGHVCCQEDKSSDGFDIDTKTHNLSYNRAKNIYEYLVRAGIRADRMIFRGYGFSEPKKFPETSDSDKDQNRRVEIRIVSN